MFVGGGVPFYRVSFNLFLLRPIGKGGLGRLQLLNTLLKFLDFVSEIGCESQGRENEDSNSYIDEETTRIYHEWNIF